MYWKFVRVCVCIFLGYTDKTLNMFQKNKWIPVSKFPWIPRTNTCNVNFICTLVLLWIPQRANIDNCSGLRKLGGFPKRRWILKVHEEYADNLRIQLTICGIRLQLADSVHFADST